ncbi:TPA: hypothetical protein N0F65_011311 [Lagenidium giganteum]|uniref:Coilin N-terminal domain-containing protein n=1 Tax=Lagenidium giganteum TaxID=4803 RepID=A0AAV2YGI2_9STRA|nr:TPA: hypothetical protein N0F65_011311 [Lagenidium giganteum]
MASLVFDGPVAQHLVTERGFAACWYLVPSYLKCVGDLVHELLTEFALQTRCRTGLTLLLDQVLLLPHQHISIVRDNDTLTVQCAARRVQWSRWDGAEDDGADAADAKSLKRKHRDGRQGRDGKSVVSDKRDRKKRKQQVDSGSEDSSSGTRAGQRLGQLRSGVRYRSFLDGSDDASSDNSDESSSEDDVRKRSRRAKKVNVAVPVRHIESTMSASSSSSDESDSESDSSNSSSSSSSSDDDEPVKAPSVVKSKPMTKETGKATSVQAVARHVRFDGEGEAVAPAEDSSSPNECVPSDLARYGPNAPVERPSRRETRQHTRTETQKQPRHGNHQDNRMHPDRQQRQNETKRKTHPKGEMWKRPYEVVASIHDDTATYPTTEASAIQVDDVIAYKTLSLCEETWQPIVSPWQCGQVTVMDGAALSLNVHALIYRNNSSSVQWSPKQGTETTVDLSTISELRFLSGPTHAAAATKAA